MSNTAKRLKKKYRDAILSDPTLHGLVASAANKSFNTVFRWCKNNSEDLTMIAVLNTVKQHLGLKSTEMLVEDVTLQEAA